MYGLTMVCCKHYRRSLSYGEEVAVANPQSRVAFLCVDSITAVLGEILTDNNLFFLNFLISN